MPTKPPPIKRNCSGKGEGEGKLGRRVELKGRTGRKEEREAKERGGGAQCLIKRNFSGGGERKAMKEEEGMEGGEGKGGMGRGNGKARCLQNHPHQAILLREGGKRVSGEEELVEGGKGKGRMEGQEGKEGGKGREGEGGLHYAMCQGGEGTQDRVGKNERKNNNCFTREIGEENQTVQTHPT